MKNFKEKVHVNLLPDTIVCNKCGRHITKDRFGYHEEYLTVDKQWGFHSDFDGERHEFDLCVNCYGEIIRDFKIKCRK